MMMTGVLVGQREDWATETAKGNVEPETATTTAAAMMTIVREEMTRTTAPREMQRHSLDEQKASKQSWWQMWLLNATSWKMRQASASGAPALVKRAWLSFSSRSTAGQRMSHCWIPMTMPCQIHRTPHKKGVPHLEGKLQETFKMRDHGV